MLNVRYTEIAKISAGSIDFLEQRETGDPIDVGPSGGFSQLSFLGIRPENFSDVAFWEESYNSNSLEDIVSKIENDKSILIQQDALDNLGLEVGDKYSYIAGINQTTSRPISYTMDISGKFDLFPNLVTSTSSSDDDNFSFGFAVPVLAHIEMVKMIGSLSGNYEVGAYIKVKNNENITLVSQKIDKLFGYDSSLTIINIDEMKNSFLKSVETQVIVMLLDGMQIITLIIVFESNAQIDSVKWHGVMKSKIVVL